MSQQNQIAERIAQIQITIEVPGALRPNVILAEPYQPTESDSNNCPFFINEIRGGDSNLPISSGQQYRSTRYAMNLCVRRKEAGTNLKLTLQETIMWTDAVYAAFAKRVKLSNPANDNTPGQSHVGLSFVLDAHISGYDAISYEYGSNEYLALQFMLLVNEFYVTEINA